MYSYMFAFLLNIFEMKLTNIIQLESA